MRYLIKVAMAMGLGWASVQVALADDCDADQAAMNACAGNDLSRLDADLNAQYQAQMTYLKAPAQKLALKDAQRKWLVFRDADCLYQVGKPENSGSIWPLLHSQCLAAHTQLRVEQLKAYVACRAEGCPE